MRHDPEKHADEFPDFRGARVCGYSITRGGCIVEGSVGNDGKLSVEREVDLNIKPVTIRCAGGVYEDHGGQWRYVRSMTKAERLTDRPLKYPWIRAFL